MIGGLHKNEKRKWEESNLTCCNTFDQLMHDLDFLWLLIDVSCQLLKHFPLIGMNTELQPKHKQFKSNHRYTLNFSGEILTPLQIMILTLNSHWPFSHKRRSIRLRRIIHLQYPSKLTEKQMDKVRWIFHPKLRPFHFQIKTYQGYPTRI